MNSPKQEEPVWEETCKPLADSAEKYLSGFCWFYFMIMYLVGFAGGSVVKNPPAMQEPQVQSLGWKDPLEKEMATYSSILAWETPRREEPGGLQSMGCKLSDSTTTNKSRFTIT